MCSIAGVIGGTLTRPERLEIAGEMNRRLAHRGPDQSGLYDDEWAALAHNRLSIIDPGNGRQPMTRSVGDRTYTIVYNGELYNTAELRQELEARGWTFRTHCDTEVLLVAFMEWDTGCLSRLNGIFAFAVYEESRRRIVLARDRLGVKPLFYTMAAEGLVFASEMKALFAHPGIKPVLDRQGLWQMVFLLPTRVPGTGVFRGVQELLPGWTLDFDADRMKLLPYWQLTAQEHHDSPDDTVERVRWLVRDAVVRQLVSDVPLCTLLSGGLDSSAISAIAAGHEHALGRQLDTYSFEYEGNREHFQRSVFQPNNDDDYALFMAEAIGTQHTVLTAGQQAIADLLDRAVEMRDLPGMGDVDSSLLYYCGQIKRRHSVGISGECADEIFGGYPWFANAPEELSGFPWLYSLDMRASLFEPDAIGAEEGKGFIHDTFARSLAECPHLPEERGRELALRQTSYLSMWYFMHNLLERKDRMSMASALEVRVPFADHRIAEYVYNIPWSIKRRADVEKAVLRDALEGILPDSIRLRKKSPYPKTHNPEYERIVTNLLEDRLRDHSSPLHALLRRDILEDLTNLNNITWFGQLMARPQLIAYLVQMDHWFRHFGVELAL